MTVSRYVQLFSGSFVVLSLALGAPASPVFHSQSWLWITGFCPMGSALRALGVKTCAAPAA